MVRAKKKLQWAYVITREEYFKKLDQKVGFNPQDWEDIRNIICESIKSDSAPVYETKIHKFLEETVQKYLRPTYEFVSLTEIAKRFDPENPLAKCLAVFVCHLKRQQRMLWNQEIGQSA